MPCHACIYMVAAVRKFRTHIDTNGHILHLVSKAIGRLLEPFFFSEHGQKLRCTVLQICIYEPIIASKIYWPVQLNLGWWRSTLSTTNVRTLLKALARRCTAEVQ